MITFLATNIIKRAQISVADGRKQYKLHFIDTSVFSPWRAGVDDILRNRGYARLIDQNRQVSVYNKYKKRIGRQKQHDNG